VMIEARISRHASRRVNSVVWSADRESIRLSPLRR
jgi:hypothetical protein